MKKDLRIIKTEHALYEALLTLMKDKTFEEIKVADICNVALINRSTFYAHYNDKYELLMAIINELKENLLVTIEQNDYDVNSKAYYLEMISLVLDHFDSRKDDYYYILMNNKSSVLIDILTEVAVKDINKRIEIGNIHKGNVPTDILVKFYLGGVFNVGIEWLSSKNKYSKQEILEYLNTLIPDAV